MTGGSPVDRVNRDEIVALASRLISIPSASGEERAVMEEVIRWCSSEDTRWSSMDLRTYASSSVMRASC